MTLIKILAEWAQPLLTSPYILRTRRNHALEHATIHILSREKRSLSGHSSDNGFVLYGEAPRASVDAAVKEALERMAAGERSLALHPDCGTNLVSAGFLFALAGWLAFAGRGWRVGWSRLPQTTLMMMALVFLSKPLGMSLQRHITTEADLGDMQLVSIERDSMTIPFSGKRLTRHRVRTRQG